MIDYLSETLPPRQAFDREIRVTDFQPQTTSVDDVLVTAARLPPAAGEAAFSVIRLGEETLSSATRLDEALATVPAVSLVS